MLQKIKNKLKNKRASEVVQNLIVIAIMGALAITAISGISTTLKGKNNEIISSIETNVGWGKDSPGK